MKIAIVHDLLVKLGGAEKVIEKLLLMYQQADLFTLIYDEKKVGSVFPKSKIKKIPSITQNIYELTKNQRFCLPFMARGVESLDLSEYDVVIADNSAFVHGCITKPETKFIVYYHTPARYMWDRTNEYKKEIGWNKGLKLFILNWMLKSLRMWDFQASQRHDITLCNSKNVAKRIKKYYGLEAEVVYPNVDVERFNKPSLLAPAELQLQDSRASTPSFTCLPEVEGDLNNPPPARGELEGGILLPKNYYIIISALTEFKKIDVSVNAFNKMPDKNLVVVGTGNFKENLEKMVTGKNIIFTGPKYGDDLVYLLQNAKGLVFSGEEDFGIVPIESFGAGIPVFAYRGGGLAETMIEGVTGEFFDNKTGEDFVEKFEIFEKNINSGKYLGEKIKEHAKNFSEEVFEEKIRAIVGE